MSETKRRGYLGLQPSGVRDYSRPPKPDEVIFCPACKSEILLTNKNNILKLYYAYGDHGDLGRAYREGRICKDCGAITVQGGDIKYEKPSDSKA